MRRILRKRLPPSRHPGPRNVIAGIEDLSDEDLVKLNRLLAWHAFVWDSKGRRFGDIEWAGKRDTAEPIPDPRIELLDQLLHLIDKHVLEVGCFEGIQSFADIDVVHHLGVLYHLTDPVTHLMEITKTARFGITLDTHHCLPSEAQDVFRSKGESFRFKRYEESRRRGVFSGMSSFARWLLLEDIEGLLDRAGFSVLEKRARLQRNGPRVLLIARAG